MIIQNCRGSDWDLIKQDFQQLPILEICTKLGQSAK